MDLSKMSVKELEQWAGNEEEYRNQPYYWQVVFDELARRLAAEEAAKDAVCDAMRRQALRRRRDPQALAGEP